MPQRKTVLPGFMGLVLLVVLVWGTMPVSGALPATTPVPTGFPTPAGSVPSGPPLSLTLTMLFTCCSLGLVAGLIVVGFILSLRKRSIGESEKQA